MCNRDYILITNNNNYIDHVRSEEEILECTKPEEKRLSIIIEEIHRAQATMLNLAPMSANDRATMQQDRAKVDRCSSQPDDEDTAPDQQLHRQPSPEIQLLVSPTEEGAQVDLQHDNLTAVRPKVRLEDVVVDVEALTGTVAAESWLCTM